MTTKTRTLWAFALSSIAIFMTALDNLVVTTALPVIKQQLGGRIDTLEWTVNGYTLTFAVLLLTGAALGDRFGRRRMFVAGLGIFTLGSAAAALAPSIQLLIAARAFQGLGGAIITPLTLTILTGAVPAEKRGTAFGAWSGIQGLAVAIGPLVGGAVTEGVSWQWIFWLNVPIGLLALPFARTKLSESYGPNKTIDLPGIGLASAGLLGIVWALMRGNTAGWLSPEIIGATGLGIAALIGFIAWELRTATPMLPMRFFRNRAFAAANAASLAMYFGMFGSVFLLTQFLQLVLGYSPLQAGIRTLAWTAMPLFIAPAAGALSDRIGGRPIMAFGLALDAIAFGWIAYNARSACPTGSCCPRWYGGHRDGIVPRPGRERGDERGSARGGRPGVRSDQRDPRDRRRARHRRPRRGVLGARRLCDAERVRRRVRPGADDRRDYRRHRRCRGPVDPAVAAPDDRDAEAGSGSRMMSRSRKSSTADQVFGKVRSGAGSYSRTDGSGECDPVVADGSSRAGALTRSARSTAAATATDTAQAPLPLEPWAPTIRSTHPRSSGQGTHRFSRTGGNHGRVA